ncbi:MAG: DUF4381 domain-containing protein [Gammaproteobacteria bacterium]|nr:DUF4381 domain-containing protein [Gammaproteobacteria bacterium]
MQDDPLSRMRDVHLPDAPGWWPPALGWWLLAALILLLVGIGVYSLVKRRRREAPRRQALAELERLNDNVRSGALPAAEAIHAANALLKRLWVHVDHDVSIAALTGDAWLAYLDGQSGSTAFSRGPGQVLGSARFASGANMFDPALVSLLRTLLKARHRVDNRVGA